MGWWEKLRRLRCASCISSNEQGLARKRGESSAFQVEEPVCVKVRDKFENRS